MNTHLLVISAILVASVLRAETTTDDAALHQQLRDLKTTYETAINSGNLAPLQPFFDANSSGVTIDNQTFHSYEELKAIYDRFRARFPGVVYEVKMTAEPSLLDGDLAVAQGTSEERVKVSDGDFHYTGTWTVVMRRTSTGWKLVRSQMTMDPFGNSVVMFFLRRVRLWYGIGGLAIGLAAGWVFGRVSAVRRGA